MAEMTSKKASRGRAPTKRSINLVSVGEKQIRPVLTIPAIIVILVLAVVLSKFFVVDRLAAVSRESGKVNDVKAKLTEGYAKIDSYGSLTDRYAHYTFSGLTPEEVDRVDRVEVLALIERNVVPGTWVNSWDLQGNILKLQVSGRSLTELNQISKQLNAEELVDLCNLTTAAKSERADSDNTVSAEISVVLSRPMEEEESVG